MSFHDDKRRTVELTRRREFNQASPDQSSCEARSRRSRPTICSASSLAKSVQRFVRFKPDRSFGTVSKLIDHVIDKFHVGLQKFKFQVLQMKRPTVNSYSPARDFERFRVHIQKRKYVFICNDP